MPMIVSLLRFFFIFILSSGCVYTQSLSPLPADGSFAAAGRVQYRPDPTRQLTLSDVLRAPDAFRPVQADITQFGKGQPPYWFRFQVGNGSAEAKLYLIEIDYPFLDSVQFAQISADGRVVQQSRPMSWASRLAERTSGHRNPLFRFVVPAGHSAWVYIRASAGPNRLSVPLRLWTDAGFRDHERFDRTFWGWLNGVFACVVFVGLMLWILLRERIYGYCALYTGAAWLYLISLEGFWLEWIDHADYGLVSAVDFRHLWNYAQLLLGLVFLRWYVLQDVYSRPWVRALYQVSLMAVGIDILLIVLNHHFVGVFENQGYWIAPLVSVNFFAPVVLSAGLVGWIAFRPASRHTHLGQSARMYLLSTAPLLLLTGASLLRNYNLIPDHLLLRPEGNAFAILIEFIILSVGLGYRYKHIADDRRRLTEQTHHQAQEAVQVQLRLQEQEVRALEAQLRLKQEKERIARDLHDHVGSQLSVIASTLDYVGIQSRNEDVESRVASVGNYARDAIQSLRDTIWAIHQENITLLEFRLKLQQFLHKQQELITSCRLVLEPNGPATATLSSLQALNLFRIVQEALHNALKHAAASQITVAYQLSADQTLHLTVSDNGRGLINDQTDAEPHYGLLNMQSRAAEMNGRCEVESTIGHGTTVRVCIWLDGTPVNMPVTQNTTVAV